MAKIALYQMENAGSVAANLEKSLAGIREAADSGADLILFPEVQLTKFFPQYPGQAVMKYACTTDSETVNAFREECAKNRIMAVPNLYLEQNGVYYDASILIGRDGGIIGIQKMVHIAQAERFYEQDYYAPSDDGFHVFDTDIGKVGIVVCFDRHYPESVRTEALRGADLILVPTVNMKAEPLETFAWEIRVQAFQNSVVIAMCNRVGTEGQMAFAGESLIADANGGLVVKADDTERMIYAGIDLTAPAKIRRARPYTSLRRKEWYE